MPNKEKGLQIVWPNGDYYETQTKWKSLSLTNGANEIV